MVFTPPKRRDTRQRSGFQVSGETTGNEVRLLHASQLKVLSETLCAKFEKVNIAAIPQFEQPFGVIGFGGYIKSEKDIEVMLQLQVFNGMDGSEIGETSTICACPESLWTRLGIYLEVPDVDTIDAMNATGCVLVASKGEALGTIQLLGYNLDAVSAYSDRDIYDQFKTKTGIYLPEIFYLEHDKIFAFPPYTVEGDIDGDIVNGEQVALKACNRCSRYLLIDVSNEQNAIGFSNILQGNSRKSDKRTWHISRLHHVQPPYHGITPARTLMYLLERVKYLEPFSTILP